MLTLFLAGTALIAQFTPEQKSQIQDIVKEYIVSHPEVLIESGQVLQKRQQENLQGKAQVAIPKQVAGLFHSDAPVLGNSNGDVSLVEFIDYQCVHCKAMSPIVDSLIHDNQQLKVIVKPLAFMGEPSAYAAKAALAAQKQGKFTEMHEALMAQREMLSDAKVLEIAKAAGLDVELLKKDIETLAPALQNNMELARQVGATVTPAFVIAASNANDQSKFRFIVGTAQKAALQEAIQTIAAKNK